MVQKHTTASVCTTNIAHEVAKSGRHVIIIIIREQCVCVCMYACFYAHHINTHTHSFIFFIANHRYYRTAHANKKRRP